MKACFKTTVVLVTGLLMHQTVFSAAPETITYENTRGSILEIDFANKDTLSGYFTTAVASKTCQSAVGMKRPIIGYALGQAITVSIDYPDCGSVVTLAGHLSPDKEKLDVIALIVQQDSLFPKGPGTQSITHDAYTKKA